ncbi:TetR/AcrR family transcriptional regulator [Actinokineospora sp. HBU206404]|uniref:TetR/AcrR family transcriptional regulator n=2 Tax=Actinokineospora xionganensis TaxID=2684470 RepID=A0ABR7L019_9PSEU|nr:TetR/AcrR family transcriptional regulator [Actinokineospora xionganensis]
MTEAVTTPATRRYSGRDAGERSAARRERLLEAALDLFGTEGYQVTPIDRLCSAAKVSTRHFYQEFTNKEAVLIALHSQITEDALTATATALAEAPAAPIEARLVAAVTAYLRTIISDPRRVRVSFVEVVGASPAVEQTRLEYREAIIATVTHEGEAAIARGEIPPRDFRFAALALIGALNSVVYDWSLHQRKSADELEVALVALATTLLTG